MPRADMEELDLEGYVTGGRSDRGWWSFYETYIVSLLKAWFGDAATPDNDFGFGALPRISGNYMHFSTMLRALDGGVDGLFLMGQNPAVGSQHAGLQRRALASLRWLVVRDLAEIESASFWRDCPEIRSGELRTEDIQTEVFLMPAASHVEKEGTFTNTQRLLQFRDKALEPPGEARQDLLIIVEMAKRLGLDWNYTHPSEVFAEMRQTMSSIAGVTWERLERDSAVTYPCEQEGDPEFGEQGLGRSRRKVDHHTKGLKHVGRNPSAKGTGHAITGIVLGSLTILGHAVILILIVAAAATSRR